MNVVLQGIGVGLLLMLFVGPSFFYLIRVGISKGFASAFYFALGIMLSDLVLLTLIIKGLSRYFDNPVFQQVFSVVAGVLIVGIGIHALISKAKISATSFDAKAHQKAWYALKGFGINILNPFTVMLWIAVIGTVELKNDYSATEYQVFVAAVLGTILVMDSLKAYLANYLGKILTQSMLTRVNRVLGFVFLVLGFRLLYHFYLLYNDISSSNTYELIERSLN